VKISGVMTKNPYVLSPQQTITDAATLFLKKHVDCAPVVHNGKLTGLITKIQLYNALADNNDLKTTIDKVMITDVVTCHPDDEIDEFINNKFSRLPVVKDGAVVGIVTGTDVVQHFKVELKDLKSIRVMMEQMDAIFEASYDYLFVTDAEGRVTKVSPSYYRITGIKPEEVLNITMYELVAMGFYDRSCSVEVIETLKPVTFVQKIKTGRTVLVTGNPVFDENGKLISVVTNGRDITELNELKTEVERVENLSQHYKKELNRIKGIEDYVFDSLVMTALMEKVSHLAQFDSAILITGESGVGKEIIAHQIHIRSPRSDKPYIRINCAAIPESLLESELFGYAEGAFTGAKKGGKLGMFELANKGTLLLDEIGELPFGMQSKLLRVIQENEIIRVGGTIPIKIDVRIIASSNRDLKEMVERNEFRRDLYYRLDVVPIRVPPLRERREEIPILINYFLNIYNNKYKLNKQIDPHLIVKLSNYNWPGNVRELKNLIERAVVSSTDNVIREITLESDSITASDEKYLELDVNNVLRKDIQEIEKNYIKVYFDKYGSTRKAANALGISQSTFCRKAAMYDIKLNDK
jgi:PAS domain S-box-containing protein